MPLKMLLHFLSLIHSLIRTLRGLLHFIFFWPPLLRPPPPCPFPGTPPKLSYSMSKWRPRMPLAAPGSLPAPPALSCDLYTSSCLSAGHWDLLLPAVLHCHLLHQVSITLYWFFPQFQNFSFLSHFIKGKAMTCNACLQDQIGNTFYSCQSHHLF